MRVVAAILFFHICVCAYSQDQNHFDFHGNNVPFKKVVTAIREQTHYYLFFQHKTRLMDKIITLDVRHISIDSFLKIYFNLGPGDYTVITRTYFIKKADPVFITHPASVINRLINVAGSISDMKGETLSGVTVVVEGTGKTTTTDADGSFSLRQVDADAILLCGHVSMDALRIPLQGRTLLNLRMREKPAELQNYNVVVPLSNGYQRMAKDRGTGSYGYIDNIVINRTVSTGVADRIENTVPGLLTNHGQSSGGIPISEMPMIRGRSTIFANALPLIVLNNFPYDGELTNINPNDIESISVLKDAAAASIWGVRAGNGVIVINTRRSKVSDSSSARTLHPLFNYSSSITFQAAPDLNNVSNISSADFIDREKELYKGGYYFTGNTTPFTPVVELLTQVDKQLIPAANANSMIEAMKTQDVRRDIRRYLYRGGISQQHYLQTSASTENAGYFLSAGWDHNLYGLRGSSYDRMSLRLQNVFRVSQPLFIETGVNFTHSTIHQDANPGFNYRSTHGNKGYYPYARLADAQGNPLPLSLDYSSDYLQGATRLGFPDWSYVPLKDRQTEDNTSKAHDLLINLGARYTLAPSINVELKYQYQNGSVNVNDVQDASAYYARDLINNYVQVNNVTNALSYPIPQGGILNYHNQVTVAHQGRLQLNYNNTWNHRSQLSAIAGYEIRSLVNEGHSDLQYGYNPENGSYNPSIDYVTNYIGWQMFSPNRIPIHAPATKLVDHFISYYANASYTHRDRYTLSASAREDGANLFGVKTNRQRVPLWSTGLAWQINNESFYHFDAFSLLKLRATYGRSGNISRLASAYTTATYPQGGSITNPSTTIGYIQGLANPNLRWEQVGMLNLGLDFAAKTRRISGSIEYYRKQGTDLIGATPGDPTLGLVQFPGTPGYYYGNSAAMNGNGIDVQLETRNLAISSPLKWTTNFIFGRAISTVEKYLLPVATGKSYLDPNIISPRIGKPLFGIYSYRWAGLAPDNGDPLGYVQGKASRDWASIYNNTSIDSMVYNGPSQPTIFGALKNTFRWRAFTASVNISYKLGYYFRRPSISYSGLFNTWAGHADYGRRWQHAGDEATTYVPSAGDPLNAPRDQFYLNSRVLVEKADHIRLEDIQLSYDLNKERYYWLPFANMRLYTYVANVLLLWKANKSGIDPYYVNIPKEGRKFSVGVNVNF
jgi:TonB-linked SusC/RagA family outer membrane protein